MRKIKLFLFSVAALFFTGQLYSQQVNNLYFIENSPYRHLMNPAMQPLSGFYLGFPVVGYSEFQFGNNSLTANSLDLAKGELYNSLKTTTNLNFGSQLNLLNFGFRAKKNYITFGLSAKAMIDINLPKDMVGLLMYGNRNPLTRALLTNNKFDFSSFGVYGNAYLEAALGYSRLIGDKWSVGAKFKYLHGIGAVNTTFTDFSITSNPTEWNFNLVGQGNSAIPEFTSTGGISQYVKPAGTGGAIDLGVTYKPFSFLTLGAAVTDFGFIKWNATSKKYNATVSSKFGAVDTLANNDMFNGVDYGILLDSVVSSVVDGNSSYTLNETTSAFTTYPGTKIQGSAEFGILKNAISLGVLSTTMFRNKQLYQDITTSLNLRPFNWLNAAISYSILNGRGSNIGAGIGFRLGMVNTFISADYVPLKSVPLSTIYSGSLPTIPVIGSVSNFKVPYKTDRFNLAVGFNIVFGNKQDNDKDGVSNRRDKCPDTPYGVIVNKKGCPLDTDGDGVYDFLDKCPDTPKEAHSTIDADGCPIDTDGDGVFDYMDKCPGTIPAAYGKVDENGCPKDTDNDGIPDYLDKCEATPEGVMVDSLGCPLDEDGDNVPDYLDKCPATPIEARGLIDSTGCPIDTDKDGVFDYLDKCPNTPEIARAAVDSTGCPKDTDKDGVADYLDKCPETPLEAKGTVDEKGCPRDTDGDGVFDYLDNCPRVAGVASNKGCPEIKKEVRQLFQKALQGIQFETAKSTIKPVSFKILDDVAKVLSENPTYLVEIQGHTDNVGKKDANQLLSENRAKAVRDYLIKKGIDEKRMTSNGYGDTKPVLPNTNAKNKAKNRRVEFVVSFEEVKIVEEEL